MTVWIYVLRWLLVLGIAFLSGGLIKYAKLPSILGWLIAGMLLGPHTAGLLPQALLDASGYKSLILFLQCAFGLMLGTELVFSRLRSYGKALVITTLTQSLGTFVVVSIVFALVFAAKGVPVFLAPVLGSIALATAPAPALSVVREFHTKGPVTDTLLPMAVFDDVVGIVVFFTVNAITARRVSGGSVPLHMIPVMIFLPIAIGLVPGFLFGALLKKPLGHAASLTVLVAGIAACTLLGMLFNRMMRGVTLNYMLMGVSFSAVFSNMSGRKSASPSSSPGSARSLALPFLPASWTSARLLMCTGFSAPAFTPSSTSHRGPPASTLAPASAQWQPTCRRPSRSTWGSRSFPTPASLSSLQALQSRNSPA